MVLRMDTPGGESGKLLCDGCGALASCLVTNHEFSHLCDRCLEVERSAQLVKADGCASVCKNCGMGMASERVDTILGVCSETCRADFIDKNSYQGRSA